MTNTTTQIIAAHDAEARRYHGERIAARRVANAPWPVETADRTWFRVTCDHHGVQWRWELGSPDRLWVRQTDVTPEGCVEEHWLDASHWTQADLLKWLGH